MEKLVLETRYRGWQHFHRLTSFPVFVGRGLDSDIIVPDITVSKKHLKIDCVEGQYSIQNLSSENGTRLNNAPLADQAVPLTIPANLSLGDLKVRLLSANTEVAPTRIKSVKSGWFSFLSSPYWAFIFVILTALSVAFGKYISTPVPQDPLIYASKILPALLLMFGLALLIASVSRLSAHRWAFIPALSIASLFLLLPTVFEVIGGFMDYFLTTDWPSTVIDNVSSFLLLPALLILYLTRVHYTRFLPALGIAVLVTMPVTAYLISDLVDQISSKSGFSPMPNYNKTLSSTDLRLKKTVEIDRFIEDSRSVLDRRVKRLLD